ncbi:MAG: tripartite tricarboxylate transporter substrate binding protein [Betaproteobacteria bacterium]|nr:tripartite tricarboxylate transporter substrate binding protein [Betaproteobacteria bacterium]
MPSNIHRQNSRSVSFSRLCFLALSLAVGTAQAQSYPDRPVRIVLAFAPGGLADVTFRVVGEKLTDLLGKPVLIENTPGAGGIAAAASVSRGKPDGHALLALTNGTAISKALFKSLPYDPIKDFAPISFAAYFDLIVVAKADGPHRSLADLLKAAKANPGKLNIGSINPGSSQNLSAELFRSTAGIEVAIVPFKTSPDVFAAVVSGQIDAAFEAYTAARSLVDGGRLSVLANTAAKRAAYLPSAPSVQEAGVPGYEVVGWNALGAPTGTPPEVIALINRHMNTIVAMPDVRKRLLALGADAYAGTPEELRTRFAADVAKWGEVIKRAGIPLQ